MNRRRLRWLAGFALVVVGLFIAAEVLARGRGGGRRGGFSRGGGGFSRSGPAMSGSIRGPRSWQRSPQRGGYSRPSTGGVSGRGPSQRPSTGVGRSPRGTSPRPSTGQRPRPSTGDVARPGTGRERSGERQRAAQEGADQSDRDAAREDRQQHREEMQQQRREYVDDVRDEREEFVEDNWYGYGEFYTGLAVGAAMSSAAFYSQSCTPTTVVVGGTSYYQCGSTWYTRAYQGGSVTYVVTDPPR